MPDIEKLGQLADDFREQHSLAHSKGWVLFWQSQPFAWCARLSPEQYRPGVLALRVDAPLLLIATGGDDENGARGFTTAHDSAP